MSHKILVVDDHEVVRLGVSELLRGCGFQIAASCECGEEAIRFVDTLRLDAVLLDVRMEPDDGLATLAQIRKVNANLPVVIFSSYDNPTYVARAAALGANDYVLKRLAPETLGATLERAIAGKKPPAESRLSVVRRLMQQEMDPSSLPPEFPLTCRETQVLRHIALGLSNKEIATSLMISVETVKEHVQNTLRKVKATDRTDAAVRAIKSGLVD